MRIRRSSRLALGLLCAGTAAAQGADATRRARLATVTGAVHDSLAQRPLAGALVQLVAADGARGFAPRTATADSLGRFTIEDIPDGRYAVGFLHPILDSLGIEPPVREILVDRAGTVRADLATPSPARLRAAICGTRPRPVTRADSGALLIGVIRNARDRSPVGGASVVVEWLEVSFTTIGIVRRTPRLVATTLENGWFAVCDVPRGGTIALLAGAGADSTDRLDEMVPISGFLRRDLYVGRARALSEGPRLGDERLFGVVTTVEGGRALQGALVRLHDGPSTRADDDGAWTLSGVPAGTRVLEARAVGFYPERRTVDILPGTSAIRIALPTLKAVLNTVRISARVADDRRRSGFDARRRSGAGRYYTPEDLARRHISLMSEFLRGLPGMRLERTPELADGTVIQMRGLVDDWCTPSILLNGQYLGELSAEDVDDWVRPQQIMGVEVYTGAGMPQQFGRGMFGPGCGTIVLWTR